MIKLPDRLKTNRIKFSGVFEDISTDLHMILGMFLTSNLEMYNGWI